MTFATAQYSIQCVPKDDVRMLIAVSVVQLVKTNLTKYPFDSHSSICYRRQTDTYLVTSFPGQLG